MNSETRTLWDAPPMPEGVRIHLINETRWNSSDLKKIIRKAMARQRMSKSRLQVICKPARTFNRYAGAHGRTLSVGTTRRGSHQGVSIVLLFLPGPDVYGATSFAQILEHELMHCVGVEHRDMTRAQRHAYQEVPWAEGCVLRYNPRPKKKPSKRASSRKAAS